MARASKPPTEPEVVEAVEALKRKILAELAARSGYVPGTQPWFDALERRIDNAINSGTFIAALKQELLVTLPRLATGGKGPVTKDPVDIS
jgi:hypothetical protein